MERLGRAGERKQAERRRRQSEERQLRLANAFPFASLPFDIQEMVMRYLPASELGMCCAVSKAWGHIYQGAVASIFAQVVGVARGRSKLMRHAELQLVHRLRNTHEPSTAIEMALWAAFNGYNDYVLRLISSPKSVLSVNSTGSEEWDSATPLHVACRQGNLKLCKSLLDLDADPACLTKSRQTPLILAVEYGFIAIVKLLLQRCGRKLRVNAQDGAGRTALFISCEKGHLDICDTLLDWYDMIQQETGEAEPIMDVNLGTLERGSPLCIACRNGHARAVERLLNAQAHVNAVTEDGRTAFFCAVEMGRMNTTKLLLRMRPAVTEAEMAEMFYRDAPHRGMEQAMKTAETEREMINVEPWNAGVLIDYANNTGKTPIFCAAERGNLPLLIELLEARANGNKPTFLNKTPLYVATENGHTEVVRELLKYCTRENVLHQTNFGTTALFMAQRNGLTAIKNMLGEFCMEKLDIEKKANRKCKKKQADYMKRLNKTKKATDQPCTQEQMSTSVSAPAAGSSNRIGESEGDRLDKDIRRSKAAVNKLFDDLKILEERVNEESSKISSGCGTTMENIRLSVKKEDDKGQSSQGREHEQYDLDSEFIESKPFEEVEEVLLQEDAEDDEDAEEGTFDDAGDEGDSVESKPSETRWADRATMPQPLERSSSVGSMEGSGPAEDSESCSGKDPSQLLAQSQEHVSKPSELKQAPSQQLSLPNQQLQARVDEAGQQLPQRQKTKEELRQERAAFYEQRFKSDTEEVKADNENAACLSTPRLVPKKEKDMMAARKWAESNTEEEARSDPLGLEDAARARAEPITPEEALASARKALSLRSIRASLMRFSSVTQSYKMSDDIFDQSFVEQKELILPIFHVMKGTRPTANAWDVFVAATLSSADTLEEKLSFLFGLFDSKSQGSLEPKVATTMLRCCCKALTKLKRSNNLLDSKTDIDNALQDLISSGDSDDIVGRSQFIEWVNESDFGRRVFHSV